MAPQPHLFSPTSPTAPQLASSPPQQQQPSIPSQLSMLQRQQPLLQQSQQEQLRLDQFQQDHQRQQHLVSMGTNVMFSTNNSNNNTVQQQQQQQQQSQQQAFAKPNWDILTGPNAIDNPMALQLGPDGPFVAHWDVSGLNLSSVRTRNSGIISAQHHASVLTQQRPAYLQSQHQHQHQQPQQVSIGYQDATQQARPQQDLMGANGHYLFNTSSPMPILSAPEMGMMSPQQSQNQYQQNQQHIASSPSHLQASCSPEMSIKASPIEPQLSWTWEEGISQQDDTYSTPAHAHLGFDGTRGDFAGAPKPLKVFTSSKKDDDGEFRKGQQFYLNIELNLEDRERFRYLRIPTENIVLPCRADGAGRIGLNTSGKRGAQAMMMPTSAQEEDVLSLKLTTFLESERERRIVVPCGRCKDKTPEILRFHPGVNGKPMIDENGMVGLRDGHVKLIASAWCASTSHHRGPGTKFSFKVELSGMTRHQPDPVLIYEGRSDEVEIYASHGRDKGTRLANKGLEKAS
ncbi:hypothetical protein BGZ65_008630 [Modicella reniformis]|uniref:Uncharacterized protein n=1 Tax=Modicella reniformis TaxID=1440133 RepID=A0A9P6SV15_9FUNG|nr:hypothetical protein BGZ65_008630 [Modicella reniformis]